VPGFGRKTQLNLVCYRCLMTFLAGGLRMYRESLIAAAPDVGLDSLVVTCSPTRSWDIPAIATAIAMPGNGPFFWPIETLDEPALVSAVQFYLRSKMTGPIAVPGLERAWRCFYRRYHRIVEQAVRKCCREGASATEPDDLVQEVWGEVVAVLPNLSYGRIRGGLSSWLIGLARRKARRSGDRSTRFDQRHACSVEGLEGSLSSRGLGPEEMCLVQEVFAQREATLARLQERVSPKSYEVFRRRFLDQQSAAEVALALDMTPGAVRTCHSRAMKELQSLLRGSTLSEWGENFGLPP
jgi:RNA polymerase sigma factor (sigma-70 family)